MRLSIRILGAEILAIETGTDDPGPGRVHQDRGESTSYPLGFVASMDKPHEIHTPDRDW